MGHVFISYSHKDKSYVEKLKHALLERGIDVWIDERIDYGEEWPKIIEQHLDESEAFILVMSDNARASKWVQNEVTRADRKKKTIVTLLLQGEPWLSVEAIQYEDVTDGSLPSEKFYEHFTVRKEKPVNRKEKHVRKLPPVFEDKTKQARASRRRGDALLAGKDYESALLAYSDAIRLNPSEANAYLGRAESYKGLDRSSEAMVDYSKTIELDSNAHRAYLGRGDLYLRIKNYPAALAEYKKAIAITPDNILACKSCADVFLLQGDIPLAMKQYVKIIKLDPLNFDAYRSR
jgi:tetratricopeptide (TPR) repeat protein